MFQMTVVDTNVIQRVQMNFCTTELILRKLMKLYLNLMYK